ncbi:MAG: hypothetical protein M3083_13750 [Actinomycetota bacterium]|nr:hypothetical protein [Actinomycetota bacterium]
MTVAIVDFVVGVFEDVHPGPIMGGLAMYDRMTFRGHLTQLYEHKGGGVRIFVWSQRVALTDSAAFAKAAIERIANDARASTTDAGRPSSPWGM